MATDATVILLANVGDHPRAYQNKSTGEQFYSFRAAVNVFQGKDKPELTQWYSVTDQNMNRMPYIKKGAPVQIMGRLKSDPVTGGPLLYNKNGVTRADFEIFANRITLIGSRDNAQPAENNSDEYEEITIAQPGMSQASDTPF